MKDLISIENPIQIIEPKDVVNTRPFIEANTIVASLNHLKQDCIIPVFSKDNESTISHFEFINETFKTVTALFPNQVVSEPDIRVSHVIKGRIPSAIGKPAKELTEDEKTIYYERCAFVINLPEITTNVNGNTLGLTIGGVRAYNQENLYSKKSLEKFKVFIGFRNKVCTNLCISTDGFSEEIKVFDTSSLGNHIEQLVLNYNKDAHISSMQQMGNYSLSETEFAHFIGKLKMLPYLTKQDLNTIEMPFFNVNDGQINSVIKDYFNCSNFGRNSDGSISLWKLYNLFTEANKSSYIDSCLSRNVSIYKLANKLVYSLKNNRRDWLLY